MGDPRLMEGKRSWESSPGVVTSGHREGSVGADDLDQHHAALNEGQVLLLIAPETQQNVRPGNI
jgi:hypothetical protein